MSTKFEQLLDLIVNEEMDKANELFHEIVVEKSRTIYENLIAQEAADEEDEEMDESMDSDEEDEEMDESMGSAEELEDSYSMEADNEPEASGREETDDFEDDVMSPDDMGDEDDMDDAGEEGGEDEAMMDIKNAIEELEAAFAELEAAQGGEDEESDEFDDMEDEEEPMGDEEPVMGPPGMMENKKRVTREYVEKVGNDWEKSSSMKSQGHYVGAGTGDKEGAPHEGKSPISSGSGKPTSHANAKNLAQDAHEAQHNTGTSPNKVNKGIVPEKGEKFASGIQNVDGKQTGVKTLSKVAGGHGAEKKGAGPGPVGAGTGDKAGQTSIDPMTNKQFLPQYGKK